MNRNRIGRNIRQTTHIICAKCGSSISIDNNRPSNILSKSCYDDEIIFNCPNCKESYDIPCSQN